ncbi:Pancreatic alpha-amylase [Halotydeus destructor]|nr:Pancreatic alpha-amylase [Halotydeus destructor]
MRRTEFHLRSQLIMTTGAGRAYSQAHFLGQRSTIVQLHEWRFEDIALECEQFLGPKGFGGVQVSPVNEHAVIVNPWFEPTVNRPWWERYQVVSYKIGSRLGDEAQLKDMVRRCNNVGVRVYVDVVLNHMTGPIDPGHGSAGSWHDSDKLDYPGVPFGSEHFNIHRCHTLNGDIHNLDDPWESRVGNLNGLKDIDQSQEYVRKVQADFLNKLVDMGVAGFRVDAARHMFPDDLAAILDKVNNLSIKFFSIRQRPFVYQEFLGSSGSEVKPTHYTHVGRVIEFRYTRVMENIIRKVPGKSLKELRDFGHSWGFLHDDDAICVIDNHDIQRGDNGDFNSRLTYRMDRWLKMATAYMLAWPYGIPKIMSSYYWPESIKNGRDENSWMGPPHNDDISIKRVTFNNDQTSDNGWICEHRWRQVANMVQFRNVAALEPVVHWWDNGCHQIAFSRGTKAFIAINNEDFPLRAMVQTALPPGVYCDIISGEFKDVRSLGRQITVDQQGMIDLDISHDWKDPMIAIHVGAMLTQERGPRNVAG